MLKYCRRSLTESRLKSSSCILTIMRTRTPQNLYTVVKLISRKRIMGYRCPILGAWTTDEHQLMFKGCRFKSARETEANQKPIQNISSFANREDCGISESLRMLSLSNPRLPGRSSLLTPEPGSGSSGEGRHHHLCLQRSARGFLSKHKGLHTTHLEPLTRRREILSLASFSTRSSKVF